MFQALAQDYKIRQLLVLADTGKSPGNSSLMCLCALLTWMYVP